MCKHEFLLSCCHYQNNIKILYGTMDFYLIVLAVLVLIILIVFILVFKFKDKISLNSNESQRPPLSFFPKVTVPNDKLIYIAGISEVEIQSILKGFCDIYNQDNFQAIIQIHKINQNQYHLIFPYDIKFDIFCYLINYLTYPQEVDNIYQPIGWMTLKNNEFNCIKETTILPIMIVIKENDQDYDHVHIVTIDEEEYEYSLNAGNYYYKEVNDGIRYQNPSKLSTNSFSNPQIVIQ